MTKQLDAAWTMNSNMLARFQHGGKLPLSLLFYAIALINASNWTRKSFNFNLETHTHTHAAISFSLHQAVARGEYYLTVWARSPVSGVWTAQENGLNMRDED